MATKKTPEFALIAVRGRQSGMENFAANRDIFVNNAGSNS